jgi:two-component system, response regulator PdtaR
MSNRRTKGTVIIVEDDMLLSLVETRIIEKLGYEVKAKAISGEDAVQKIKSIQPDVVIMDISLKGEMDGIDAMNRVRSFSNVPVIYLSGNGDKLSKERARKTQYVEYLVKPINPGDIEAPLEKAMKLNREELLISHAS